SSAALIMAAPASLPDAIEKISGVIPLSQTIGLWQSLLVAAVLIVVSMALAYYSAPTESNARNVSDMDVVQLPVRSEIGPIRQPGEWLEHSPLLTIVIGILGFGYLGLSVLTEGPATLLQLNNYIFLFLLVGLLLHWRPKSFTAAITAAVGP